MIWSKKNLTASFQNELQPLFDTSQRHHAVTAGKKTWVECNFLPCIFEQKWGIPTPQRSHLHLLSHMGLRISLQKEKGRKCSLWRKEQKESRIGTAKQVPLLAKMLWLPDGGEGSWLLPCGKNCIAQYLPGASISCPMKLSCPLLLPVVECRSSIFKEK